MYYFVLFVNVFPFDYVVAVVDAVVDAAVVVGGRVRWMKGSYYRRSLAIDRVGDLVRV